MVYKFRRSFSTARWVRRASPNAISAVGISLTSRAAFTTHWLWLLTLFTVAGFFEAVFWGQLLTFAWFAKLLNDGGLVFCGVNAHRCCCVTIL